MRVYIAGPVSGHGDYNYPAFHAAAKKLRSMGLEVLSPAEDDNGDPLTPPQGENTPLEYQDRLKDGLQKLLYCNAIYLLPHWEENYGARVEHDVAQALGMISMESMI